jgi:hypothetical protein
MRSLTEKELGANASAHEDVCNMLNSMYTTKNKDYGDSFAESIHEFGLIASIVRIGDKFNRIKSLIKHGKAEVNESIEDTFLDMANYCIMTYMAINKEKNNTK